MSQLVDSLWGHSKFKTAQTLRPVTPFGGLVSFIGFLKQAGFCEQVGRNMPWQLTSPNAIAPEHTVTAFIIGVVIGARRFTHIELAKADRALHAMLGLKRWPGADTREAVTVYLDTLNQELKAVQSDYSISEQEWDRYLNGLAGTVLAVEGNRQVPLILKGATVAGGAIVVKIG